MKNYSYKDYSYNEAIDFFMNLPHFVPPKALKKSSDMFSLDAELALLKKLDNPHQDLKYIHVAGTNGKGSTSAFIASILKEAKIKVGLFTSPFLYSYNEMFRVNGEPISDLEFAKCFSRVKPAYDQLTALGIFPSEYEILTVMAFIYFKEMGCELVVMEVSMGGRVDTTNVIPAPVVSVITPISYDHMTILGNTLSEIATEKAGIIKKGTSVISAAQEQEVCLVLTKTCNSLNVDLQFAMIPKAVERSLKGQRFKVGERTISFETGLLGTYQVDNASLAISVAYKLKELGYNISDSAIKDGIKNTKWFGRFSLISYNPPVIIDGGHNRQGAEALKDSLRAYFKDKRITFIIGILADKEIDLMIDNLLPIAKEFFTVEVSNSRTMKADDLAELIKQKGGKATPIEGNFDLDAIKENAEVVCIAGSLYLFNGKINQSVI